MNLAQTLSQLSKSAAAELGERNGRSLSTVTATGFSKVLPLTPAQSEDLVHGALIALPLVPKEARGPIAAVLGVAYLLGR